VPAPEPSACTSLQGSRANSFRKPTARAPLILSTQVSSQKKTTFRHGAAHRARTWPLATADDDRSRSGRRLATPTELGVTRAVEGVIHHHAGGLHQRVADGRPDEAEACLLQGLAHRLRLGSEYRHLADMRRMVDARLAADERPQPVGRRLLTQPGTGIVTHRLQLATVADHARILQQPFDVGIVQHSQAPGVETVQNLTQIVTSAQHGKPGQPGLEGLQYQQFEQHVGIALRHAPLLIVVGDVEGIFGTPGTAWHQRFLPSRSSQSDILPRFERSPKRPPPNPVGTLLPASAQVKFREPDYARRAHLPRPDPGPAAILGRAGLRDPATL